MAQYNVKIKQVLNFPKSISNKKYILKKITLNIYVYLIDENNERYYFCGVSWLSAFIREVFFHI